MTDALANIVRAAEVLILDFDGPVAALFAGYSAPAIAEELRDLAASRGYHFTAQGPFALLHEAASLGDEQLTRHVATGVRDAEMKASEHATPTPGLDAVLAAARTSRRRVAIASNNAVEAVEKHLRDRNLIEHVDLVVRRYDSMDPGLLKPHPHLVNLALERLSATPEVAVFVGDSPSDIEAGRAAHIPTIGYANKPGKHERLKYAGADTIIDHMAELADVLRMVPILTR